MYTKQLLTPCNAPEPVELCCMRTSWVNAQCAASSGCAGRSRMVLPVGTRSFQSILSHWLSSCAVVCKRPFTSLSTNCSKAGAAAAGARGGGGLQAPEDQEKFDAPKSMALYCCHRSYDITDSHTETPAAKRERRRREREAEPVYAKQLEDLPLEDIAKEMQDSWQLKVRAASLDMGILDGVQMVSDPTF